jgi:hypothetical protein
MGIYIGNNCEYNDLSCSINSKIRKSNIVMIINRKVIFATKKSHYCVITKLTHGIHSKANSDELQARLNQLSNGRKDGEWHSMSTNVKSCMLAGEILGTNTYIMDGQGTRNRMQKRHWSEHTSHNEAISSMR